MLWLSDYGSEESDVDDSLLLRKINPQAAGAQACAFLESIDLGRIVNHLPTNEIECVDTLLPLIAKMC